MDDSTNDDESESEAEPPAQSYNALLEGFGHKHEHTSSRRKRRKLNDHTVLNHGAPTDHPVEANGKSHGELLKAFNGPAATETSSHSFDKVEGTKRNKLKRTIVEDAPQASSEEDQSADAGEDDADEDDENSEEVDEGPDVESEDEDLADPFETQLNPKDDHEVKRRIDRIGTGTWSVTRESFGTIGNCTMNTPGKVPLTSPSKPPRSIKEMSFLKRRLQQTAPGSMKVLDRIQQALAPRLLNYEDILFTARSPANAASLRDLACLHALNHVYKTRDKILKNNSRLAADAEFEARDQGFTRPKVLFLTETRQNCAKYAERIIELSGSEQVENKKRFFDNFLSTDQHPEDMPDDFRELFDGNDDNVFRVGLKFTRKTMKFFSQFYASDIILASPLGLRLAIEGKGPKKHDADFLSSIELLVIDQADAMLMQNWEHVAYVLDRLNLQPKESHGCDYGRVRHWYLDGHAKHLRQTVIFSAFANPVLLNLYGTHMQNIAGKLKHQPSYTGAIADPSTHLLNIRQTFSRFHASSPAMEPDARFQYFTTAVLPSLTRLPKPTDGGQGILIFVQSHADFSRLQNYFATAKEAMNVSFGAISEFTQPSDVRRARSHFERGRHAMLLYSARAHHFRRYRLKGVRMVLFYGLPDNPIFYQEIVGGFLGQSAASGRVGPNEAAVRAVFCKWDMLALERIVGSSRVKAMIRDGAGGDTFDFV